MLNANAAYLRSFCYMPRCLVSASVKRGPHGRAFFFLLNISSL